MRSLFRAVGRIFHDTRGVSATIVAIALPGLIGFGALGAEAGAWFALKLHNQSAADAAAIAAGYTVIAGKTNVGVDLTPAAGEAATRNGYNGLTPSVIYPYSDSLVSNGVEVVLQQTYRALLAAMFLTDVNVVSTSVAVIEVRDDTCILALGRSGAGVEVQTNTHLDAPDCSIAANSIGTDAVELQDTTTSIAAATIVTVGEISLNGVPIDPASPPPELALGFPAMIGAPSAADPYASTLTHSSLAFGMPTAIRCKSKTSGHVRVYYPGNCVVAGTSLTQKQILLSANTQISGTWNITSGQTVDLSPGAYWLTGDFGIQSNATLKCSGCDNAAGVGVTIILTELSNKVGAISVAASAMLNLNAPSSGQFGGLVIIQDSNGLPVGTTYTSLHSTIGGAPGATVNGLVYFPNSSVTFHGTPSGTGPRCLVLVASAVDIDAASSLDTTGCARAGLASLPSVSTVALAE